MPIAFVVVGSGQGTTAGVNTTGADFIVVACGGNAAQTITDSRGNTYSYATTYSGNPGSGVIFHRLAYCHNPSVGSGHTFTASGGSVYSLIAAAFSGVKTSAALDQENGALSNASPIGANSITPTENNELIVFGASYGKSADPTSVSGGFTLAADLAAIPSNRYGAALAYLIQTTAASASPQFTHSNGAAEAAASLASFREAVGAASMFPKRGGASFRNLFLM